MSGELPPFVLDSFALIAYFCAEPGGEIVKELLEKALNLELDLHLSIINLGEMYYILYKTRGKDFADSAVEDTNNLPIQVISITDSQVWDAAEIKAHFSISYADAFAASLAQSLNASIVTGDPEFNNIINGPNIIWIN
ncbi:MAG: hypothetical protein A2X25_06795 [Chloroflexi bacterium GWB2_49_20]|nr:MAG: hypothetical protein A2X25_06795 [Chloroflexi bacterium GWB2_49_20]OGN80254.1 MAG: hypothetical protein A2X26_07985 [Chloroflexi bacterium GWC2_49_37]OGN86106.1 MAG: hypothetical protein A2X27_00760 [Chloroflexi bacterium GWD2_49_16]HCC79411.1 VapC toxin family PIN domain ribonuclease [Anaerolineae bacterium]HCM96368.1 VapC toxin family PIN domain ribonuclease [Anaerolineae bacterium]